MRRLTHFATIAGALLVFIAGCGNGAKNNGNVLPTQAQPKAAAATVAAVATTMVAPTATQTNTTSPAAPAASAAVDSCTAVTQAEAAAALGHAVKAPVRGRATVEGGVACVFYGPAAPAGADPDVPVTDSVRAVLVRGPDVGVILQ